MNLKRWSLRSLLSHLSLPWNLLYFIYWKFFKAPLGAKIILESSSFRACHYWRTWSLFDLLVSSEAIDSAKILREQCSKGSCSHWSDRGFPHPVDRGIVSSLARDSGDESKWCSSQLTTGNPNDDKTVAMAIVISLMQGDQVFGVKKRPIVN